MAETLEKFVFFHLIDLPFFLIYAIEVTEVIFLKTTYYVYGMNHLAQSTLLTSLLSGTEGILQVKHDALSPLFRITFNERQIGENDITDLIRHNGYLCNVLKDDSIPHVRNMTLPTLLFTIAAIGGCVVSLSYDHLIGCIITGAAFILTIAMNLNHLRQGFNFLMKKRYNAQAFLIIIALAGIIQAAAGIVYKTPLFGLIMLPLALTIELAFDNKHQKDLETFAHLKEFHNLMPHQCTVVRNNTRKEVLANEVIVGDVIIVAKDQIIPADGTILRGYSDVDTDLISHEGKQRVTPQTKVYAGFRNLGETLEIEATEVNHTRYRKQLDKTEQLMKEALAYSAPSSASTRNYCLLICLAAAASLATSLYIPLPVSLALCAAVLVLYQPEYISHRLSFIALKELADYLDKGIWFRNYQTYLDLRKTQKMIVEKKGLLMEEVPSVTDIMLGKNTSSYEFYQLCHMLMNRQNSRIAQGVKAYFKNTELRSLSNMDKASTISFRENNTTIAGDIEVMKANQVNVAGVEKIAADNAANGLETLFIAKNQEIIGFLNIRDVPKPDTKETLSQLNSMCGLTVMCEENANKNRDFFSSLDFTNYISEAQFTDRNQLLVQYKAEHKPCIYAYTDKDTPYVEEGTIKALFDQKGDINDEHITFTGSNLGYLVDLLKQSANLPKALSNAERNSYLIQIAIIVLMIIGTWFIR